MSNVFRLLFVVGDFIFLNSSIVLSFYLTNHSTFYLAGTNEIYLILFSNLAWLFLIMVASPYQITKGWQISTILKSQLAFILIHLLVVASLISFFNKKYQISQIALIYVIFTLIFFFWKIIAYYIRRISVADIPHKNFIIVGRNSVALSLRKYYLSHPELKYRFHGYFDLEPIEKIKKFCEQNEIQEILCCFFDQRADNLKKIIAFGLDSLIKTRIITDLNGSSDSLSFDPLDKQPRIDFAAVALDSPLNRLAKRSFDVVFTSLFLILVMSWLLPIIAFLIKIDSKGPVFFRQPRSGRDNKHFSCIKFRTMRLNEEADVKQATKDDPRITRLGKFLRKTSIDELPQFFNVFIGDMSLIGPRPHPLHLNEKFAPYIEKLASRHYVRPGITGLAQAMGYRGETRTIAEMKNRITLDRFYIENWSFGLDIKIIYLTVISLLRGSDKAY